MRAILFLLFAGFAMAQVQPLDTSLMPHPFQQQIIVAPGVPDPMPGIIANGVKPPQSESVADQRLKLEQIRQIELQNKQLQVQLDQQKKAAAAQPMAPPTVPPQSTANKTDSSSGDIHSHGLLNGRWWRGLNRDYKLVFLLGIMDAIRLDPQPGSGLLVPTGTLEEAAEAVDLFFTDSSNRPVPIIESLLIVTMRDHGDDPDKVEQVAASLRKRASGDAPPAAQFGK